MTTDASELQLPHVRQFSIGFVLTDPPAPKVLGSGVLLSVGNASGILTCAHVADEYRHRTEIGLLRFSRDGVVQRQKLMLEGTVTIVIATDDMGKNPYAIDLAFTKLPEQDVATFNATCVFLNSGLNMKKFIDGEPAHRTRVDAVFGLVHEFSDKPIAEGGSVTTPMQGVLTPGHIVERHNGAMTLECMDSNVAQLPKCFGGTSGGGLWRMYLDQTMGGSYTEVQTRLCGVASFQRDATHIVCQGIERIEQVLIPAIRKQWG